MLKAFILAAGLGTRLKPITDNIPKCLLPFGNKPLLQVTLELLDQHGVDEVLVNSHAHYDSVKSFLDTLNLKKPHITCVYEHELLGSAGTLMANRDWIEDQQPFLILYGDNLTNVNLSAMYSFHVTHGLPFTLGTFKTNAPNCCGIAEVGADGVVESFEEKPRHPKSDLAAAGIYVTDRRIFDFFPQEAKLLKPLDLGFHIIPNLVGKMKSYFISDFLMDIGTPESYQAAQMAYAEIFQAPVERI
ncbi:Nucleotidyl transferase family enzyme [uncultured Desulfobacterium sp.]|uniref:Nucleotidyl transferase family enzyme n=1 Tax=uncultured Desulfobacterium sp. TaxID=201089 RepID=A0A445N411_9BACT|nr:Nucleotidyl transferase family enzyme [uncultured Desulfobacterium sp.]